MLNAINYPMPKEFKECEIRQHSCNSNEFCHFFSQVGETCRAHKKCLANRARVHRLYRRRVACWGIGYNEGITETFLFGGLVPRGSPDLQNVDEQ